MFPTGGGSLGSERSLQRIRLLVFPFQASQQTSLGPIQLLCNKAKDDRVSLSLLPAKTSSIGTSYTYNSSGPNLI